MRMSNRMHRHRWMMAIGAALLLGVTAKADDGTSDLILDLFVKKGFVSQEEADKVKAQAEALHTNQMAAEMPPASESNWGITKMLKNEQFDGDVRLRYEDRSATDPAGNSIGLQRFRYAVRVGLHGNLFDDFYYGVRVETSANPRSSWGSFGTASSGVPYQAPYGKSTAGINIGQAYLGWHPEEWVDLTLGKMPNPLYTTSLIWDGDINPEGAAERFKYPVGEAEFFATFGQFIYESFSPVSADGGFGISGLSKLNIDNIFQLAWQAGLKYHFTTNTSLKVAATLYQYTGLHQSSIASFNSLSPYYGDPYIGEGAYYLMPGNAAGYSGYPNSGGIQGYGSVGFPLNQVGLNHLMVLELPVEFNFKFWNLDARLFGDFAYNLEGAQRAKDAVAAYSYVLSHTPGASISSAPFSAQTDDVKAYQVGLDVASSGGQGLISGSVAKKHAWEFKTYWQHIEQYALDPNIIDSDAFEGRENMEGIYMALGYGITDNLIGSVNYGHANRINKLLGTGGSNQDIPWMNPINSFDLIQVNLTLKF